MHLLCNRQYRTHVLHIALRFLGIAKCICVNLFLFIIVDDPSENNEKKPFWTWLEMMHIYATVNLLSKLD